MDLRQAAYAVAVAEHGSFTRAARALHLAQPSLSQSIRALERELGADLFARLGRTVRLTPAGEAFLEPARAMLRDADTARAAVDAVAALARGHLDLVVLPTLAVDPTATIVGTFRRAHPGVQVRIQEPEATNDMRAAIRSGRSELGIADTVGPGEGLLVEPLFEQPYLVVAPPGTRLGRAGHVAIGDLAGHAILTTPPATSTRVLTESAFAGAGIEPTIAVETAHRESLIPLVLGGAGIALLPEPLANDAAARGAVALRIQPRITRTVALLRRDGTLSPAAAAFRAMAIADAGARRRSH